MEWLGNVARCVCALRKKKKKKKEAEELGFFSLAFVAGCFLLHKSGVGGGELASRAPHPQPVGGGSGRHLSDQLPGPSAAGIRSVIYGHSAAQGAFSAASWQLV